MPDENQELDRIRRVYAARGTSQRHVGFTRAICAERERVYGQILKQRFGDLATIDIVELGCGEGGELQRLIALGASPRKLIGIDLLEDRTVRARSQLPQGTTIICGDASNTSLPSGCCDVVFLSTVLSSVLDPSLRVAIAGEAWRIVRPGGGVLWYDFVINNPRNPNVRGVPRDEVCRLFPAARPEFHRVTMAPPVARTICHLSHHLYSPINRILPFLRTHVVAWIPRGLDARACVQRSGA